MLLLPHSEAEIRVEVERQLGTRLTAKQWKILVDAGDVGALLQGVGTIHDLVRQVQKLQEAFGATATTDIAPVQIRPREQISPRRKDNAQEYSFTRQDALCLAVAARAAKDPEVLAFRDEVLDDCLLAYTLDSSREGVEEWIPRQIERERPQLEAFPGEPPQLTYIEAIGQGLELTPVVAGGVLDRLRVLGDRLAARYRWQAPAAIAFVLVGDVVPTIEVLTATIEPNPVVPALSRITLSVDPAATPAAVARGYRQARNHIAQARAKQPKTLFLAAFAAERPHRESIPLQMAAWNATVPDPAWQYSPDQGPNFVRDRNLAIARLVRPTDQLPAQEETFNYDDLITQIDSAYAHRADRAGHDEHEDTP